MTDTTSIVDTLQRQNNLLASIQQCLSNSTAELTALVALLTAGLTVNTSVPTYTVAGLPASAPLAHLAFATNGRNPAEGVGAGTGCVVVGNGAATWKAIWSGVAVTA